MGVSATVVVPARSFGLGEAMAAHPDLRVELERAVPLGGAVAPSVWVVGTDPARVRSVVAADCAVARADVLGERDGRVLLGVEWRADRSDLVEALADAGATCLRGTGANGRWDLSLRFPTEESLGECYRRCTARGVDLTVTRLDRSSAPRCDLPDARLTRPQRESLCRALETGYFAVPRETTLRELAGDLGVSDTAASQRIRRGLAALLREALA